MIGAGEALVAQLKAREGAKLFLGCCQTNAN